VSGEARAKSCGTRGTICTCLARSPPSPLSLRERAGVRDAGAGGAPLPAPLTPALPPGGRERCPLSLNTYDHLSHGSHLSHLSHLSHVCLSARTLPAPFRRVADGSGVSLELSKSYAGLAPSAAHATKLDAGLPRSLSAPRGSPIVKKTPAVFFTSPAAMMAITLISTSTYDHRPATAEKKDTRCLFHPGRGGPRRRLGSCVGATRRWSARAYEGQAATSGRALPPLHGSSR